MFAFNTASLHFNILSTGSEYRRSFQPANPQCIRTCKMHQCKICSEIHDILATCNVDFKMQMFIGI